MKSEFKSPLHQTVSTTKTQYWNDSCAIEELKYAIEHGAVGATTNPSIVLEVLKKEMPVWKDRIPRIIHDNPTASDIEVTWKLIEEMAVKAAKLLEGRGRLSIQTNPTLYRNAEAMVAQAVHFSGLAPNMQVKLPATSAGIAAIEEVTARGININATVSFSVPQALAVAEAVERGLNRGHKAGHDVASMAPVCTIMIGRLDDWMQVLAERDGTIANPASLHWAGVAAMKKAYGIFKARGYRTRLLAAAYRHHLHWSELIGGDLILTMPHVWQKRFNASKVEVRPRIDVPVAREIVAELHERFADFRRAYDEDGMQLRDFDTFGPTVRTLRAFSSAYYELVGVIRDIMLPNPDLK